MSDRFSGFLFNYSIAICDDDVLFNDYQREWHKNNCKNENCPMKKVKEVKKK